MKTFTWLLLPILIQTAACNNDRNCFLNFIENERDKDFNYVYRIEKVLGGQSQAVDTIALARKGERTAWVGSNVISVKTSRWSYAAYPVQGISITNVNNGSSSYFYAPQDFISVLEFARDSANTISCHPSTGDDGVLVAISLRNNALYMQGLHLQLSPNGSARSMEVVYRDSTSMITMNYSMIEQDEAVNRARPYLDMLNEEDGDLVPMGELAGFKSITQDRIR